MTTTPAELVIYDLDGTLLDSFADIAEALNHGLAQCGLPTYTVAVVKTMVGEGINRLIEKALPAGSEGEFDRLLGLVAEYYKAHPVGHSTLFPGVAETLATLRGRGLRQAILTNKPHLIALDSCARVGLGELVDFIQGEDAANPLKPHPEAGLALARRFGVAPERCLIVGDGEPDYVLSRACAIPMAACTWGVLKREEIARMKPEYVIEEIGGLCGLGILGGSND